MSVFETERLTYPDDVYAIHSIPLGRETQRYRRLNVLLLVSLGVVSSVTLVLAVIAIVRTGTAQTVKAVPESPAGQSSVGGNDTQTANRFQPTRKVAFGSCSSYDLRPQPIWTEGVVPAQPDAWIWVGDMAYLDTSPVSCDLNDIRFLTGWCNCTAGYMSMPGQCMAGDIDAARERWVHAIHQPDYRAFLNFMCPPMHGAAAAPAVSLSASTGFGAEPGRFPPTGTDPTICPRPIFGVYDDHDFGWNNGNRRLPNKAEFKRMFLDAVGEAPGSARRRADAGLQAVYTLNGGSPGRDIDVVLLDERWYRDTLPCQMRQGWCQTILQSAAGSTHPMRGWCRDFLLDDGVTGRGSCCTKDQDLAAWCAMSSSAADPLWPAACDPTSREWGTVPLLLGVDNATLRLLDEDLWSSDQFAVLWPRVLQVGRDWG
ncbi:hypothetical protein Vafri_2150 [Volvox africanus]|nr:hypothetical protein Vafri_2150 [Volvox africanus]